MQEALFYTIEKNQLICKNCIKKCNILINKSGFCERKINKDNILYCVSPLVDSLEITHVELIPLFNYYPSRKVLKISGKGCNLNCFFCNKKQEFSPIKTFQEPTIEDILKTLKENELLGVVFQDMEPSIYLEKIYELAPKISKNGFKNIIATNGLFNRETFKKIEPYIDSLIIKLKGFSQKTYKALGLSSGFEELLLFVESINKNIHLELMFDVFKEFEEVKTEFEQLVLWIKRRLSKETPLHIRKISKEKGFQNDNFIDDDFLEYLYLIAKREELLYVYLSNFYGHPNESTYCPKCGSLIIERSQQEIIKINFDESISCPVCGAKIKIKI